jgi:transcriptional regulator with XRE-family HTH domain
LGKFEPKACGRRLLTLRRRLRLSQKEFAEVVGRTSSAVAHWETGRYIIPTEILAKLIELYRVNPLWLLFGEGSIFLDSTSTEKVKEKGIYSVTELKGKFLLIKETAEDMIKSGEYQTSAGKKLTSAGEKLKRLLDELLNDGKED